MEYWKESMSWPLQHDWDGRNIKHLGLNGLMPSGKLLVRQPMPEWGVTFVTVGSHDTDPFAAQDVRMTNDDITTIRNSLKAWRNVAHSFRRGGLQTEWEEAKMALEALDRVEEELKPRQTEMDI